MANFNYGNSFNSYEGENVGVQRISVWKSVREFFPGGACLSAEDYSDNVNVWAGGVALKVGDIVPAGTAIGVDKPGGKPTFIKGTKDENIIGLTYEDVVLGTDGATFTIVTRGELLVSRLQHISPSATPGNNQQVQEKLFGRISFIKEVD